MNCFHWILLAIDRRFQCTLGLHYLDIVRASYELQSVVFRCTKKNQHHAHIFSHVLIAYSYEYANMKFLKVSTEGCTERLISNVEKNGWVILSIMYIKSENQHRWKCHKLNKPTEIPN